MSNHPAPQITLHPSGLSQDQIDDCEAKFSSWQNFVNLCCAATAVLFLVGTRYALLFASRALANSDGLSGLHIHYQQDLWWFFPTIGAVSLSFEIVLQIWSLFIGRGIVNLYVEWAARQPKRYRGGETYYDSRKLFRWFTLVLALPIGILTVLALRAHTTFAEDGMHEYDYAFAAPKIYTYSQMRQVAQVDGVLSKHYKFIPRPYVVIDFADGHRWSQHNWDDSTLGLTAALRAKLKEHTSLPFADVLILEDLPKPSSRN